MGILSAGAGAADGLKELLTEMLAQQANKRADTQVSETGRHNLAQEGLEGERIKSTERERVSRDSMMAHNYQDQSDRAARDDGRALAEEIPGGTMIPETDPGVSQMRRAGLDSILRGVKSRPAVDVGPLQPEDSGGAVPVDSVLKMKTFGQQEKANTETRADKTADERGRHDRAMENRPSSGGNVLIRTGDGYMRRDDANKVLSGGGSVPGPDSAQVTNRRDMATAVGSHFDDAESLINEADHRGLLGPIAGRTFSEFLAGKVGSTGNADDDELLGDLKTSLSMVRSGTASLHGRSGANVGIAKDIERKMDDGHMSAAELKGSLKALRKWVSTYATKPGKEGAAGVASSSDPYEEYLKRKQ